MSANFYNASGKMRGLDYHDYWGCAPEVPLVPILGKAFYDVEAYFNSDCADESARLKKVTSDGKPMLQGGFAATKIIHLPVLPVPLLLPYVPLEEPLCEKIYRSSSSTAVLKKGSVTGVGVSLAVCIHGSFGINLNCGDPTDGVLDVVKNVNSVMTEPSAADFVAAWANAAINGIVGKVVGDALEKLLGDGLLEPIRKRIEEKIKDWLNKELKDWSEKQVRDTLASMGVTHV